MAGLLIPKGTVRIVERGQAWNGMYEILGREVRVHSAYGSQRAPIGRRDPKDVARAMMRDLVREWCATQASR